MCKINEIKIRALMICSVLIFFFFLGCGYKFVGNSILLPKNMKKLAIGKINNPTSDTTLAQDIRSVIIDEFSKRDSSIQWTKINNADAKIDVDIVDYFKETSIEDPDKVTVKSNLCITIRFFIFDIEDKLLYDSKNIQKCESIGEIGSNRNEYDAKTKIIQDAVKQMILGLDAGF